MNFEFDEKAYRKFQYKVLPICGVVGITGVILHETIELNPIVFILFPLPALLYSLTQIKFFKKFISDKNSEKVTLSNNEFHYIKASDNYSISRSLEDVISSSYKCYFTIPIVTVNFKNNEQLKLYWLKNSELLSKTISKV